MKRLLFLVMATCALTFTSCVSNRYCASTFSTQAPAKVPLVLPYVDVFAVSGGQEAYSDSLSTVASEILTGILDENLSQFPVSEFIRIDDEDFDRLVGRDGAALAYAPKVNTSDGVKTRAKRIASVPLPESIRQLMDDNDLPYLMLLYENGFKRVKGDVVKETAKNAAVSVGLAALIAVATLGNVMVVPSIDVPNPYATTFTLMVADRANNSVVYYNTVEEIYDPLSRSEIYTLLHRLFKKYPVK